jgi:4-hydroxy-4-methyl-2-oxoglutarate aldolase
MTATHDLIAQARELGAATLHEAAGRTGQLPAHFRPVSDDMRIAGPAFTVVCPPGDNLWIHRAIYAARPGDVLVVTTGDTVAEWGYWGEILSVAAHAAGLGGLVLEGGSRDHAALPVVGFPVFSLGACIRGTIKDKQLDHGTFGPAIQLGNTTVQPGDIVVGDIDGVVSLAVSALAATVRLGHERVAKETDVMNALRDGANTLDMYDLR